MKSFSFFFMAFLCISILFKDNIINYCINILIEDKIPTIITHVTQTKSNTSKRYIKKAYATSLLQQKENNKHYQEVWAALDVSLPWIRNYPINFLKILLWNKKL